MDTCIMKREDVQKEIIKVFGKKYNFFEIERILGGAQKGTFRVECDNNFVVVLHTWDTSCNYFDFNREEGAGFTSNSAVQFKTNNKILRDNRISTPEIYYIDTSKSKYTFDYAFVEYIQGSELEPLLYNDKYNCDETLTDLSVNLERMYSIKSIHAGDILNLKNNEFKCENYVKKNMQKDLDYLISNYEGINKNKDKINYVGQSLYNKIEERKQYTLVHWELGPNHVMVDKHNKTYLIDIEGLRYFDLEYEHSFLKLRFGEYYECFQRNDLDNSRINFYKFYHHISCVTGAHILLQKNYYNTKELNDMIKYNYEQILEFM